MEEQTNFDWTAFNQLVSSHFVAATPTTMSVTYGRLPDLRKQLMQEGHLPISSSNRAVDIIAKMPQRVLKLLVAPIQQGLLDLETVFYLKNEDGTEQIAISAEEFLQLVEVHFTGKKDEEEAVFNLSDAATIPPSLLDAWNRALEKHKNSAALESLHNQREYHDEVIHDINQRQTSDASRKSTVSTIFEPTNPSEYAYDELYSPQIVQHGNILQNCDLKMKIASLVAAVVLFAVILALGLFLAFGRPSNEPHASTTTNTPVTTPINATLITDCYDWRYKLGYEENGIYTIYPNGTEPFDVYCDMVTDGGGWTVFQKRTDDSLVFWNRNWTEYKNGFDNGLIRNFWLGNDNIHLLSSKDPEVQLRIDIWGDRAPGSSRANGYWFGKYNLFSVANEANNYTLHVDEATARNTSNTNKSDDGFSKNYGRPFTTIDVSSVYDKNCDGKQGGWWMDLGCSYVALNGEYVPPTWKSMSGFVWYSNKLGFINPSRSEMKLRKNLDNR